MNKTTVAFKKPNIFHSRIKLLRIIGCWPMIGSVKTKSEIFYSMGTFIIISNLFLGSFLTFYSTVLLFIEHGRFNEIVCNQMIVFIIAFQIFSKVVVMLLKAPKIRRLIDELNNYLCDEFVVKTDDYKIIQKCFKYDKKLALFICLFSLLVTVVNMVKPLIVTLAKRWKQVTDNDFSSVEGILPSNYPFKLDAASFWYGFWYAQQCVYIYPGLMVSWISDSLFCSFLYYLCGHFEILINNIRKDASYISSQNGRKRLVLHHRYLIEFSKKLISAFAPLMVIQLLLGAITIGCLMIQFLLMNEGSPVQYLKPLLYLILKLIQLYILCWHGQLLLDKSMAVGEAVYFSPWYTQSRACNVDLKIVMIRSRKPTKFAYAGIFQFSASRFAHILNTAYGYFAMMNSIKQE